MSNKCFSFIDGQLRLYQTQAECSYALNEISTDKFYHPYDINLYCLKNKNISLETFLTIKSLKKGTIPNICNETAGIFNDLVKIYHDQTTNVKLTPVSYLDALQLKKQGYSQEKSFLVYINENTIHYTKGYLMRREELPKNIRFVSAPLIYEVYDNFVSSGILENLHLEDKVLNLIHEVIYNT